MRFYLYLQQRKIYREYADKLMKSPIRYCYPDLYNTVKATNKNPHKKKNRKKVFVISSLRLKSFSKICLMKKI